jgi:hypothetical protein
MVELVATEGGVPSATARARLAAASAAAAGVGAAQLPSATVKALGPLVAGYNTN